MIDVMLDNGAYLPTRAHELDAGLDIKARERQVVPADGSAVFHTGVHVAIPMGAAGILISKSGLNIKNDMTSTGLIDSGYTGEIHVKLYNHSKSEDYVVEAGDKISQLIIVPCMLDSLNLVDSFPDTARGAGAMGSTGR